MKNTVGGVVASIVCSCLFSEAAVGMLQQSLEAQIESAIANDNADRLMTLMSNTNYSKVKSLAETACCYGSINVLKFLINRGLSDVLAADKGTALSLYLDAISGGNLDIIHLLAPYITTDTYDDITSALKAAITKFKKSRVLQEAISSCNFDIIKWVADNLPKDYERFSYRPFILFGTIGQYRSLEEIKNLFKIKSRLPINVDHLGCLLYMLQGACESSRESLEKIKWLIEYFKKMGFNNITDLNEQGDNYIDVLGQLDSTNPVLMVTGYAIHNPDTEVLDSILAWVDSDGLKNNFPFIFQQACGSGFMHNVIHMLELKQQKYRGIIDDDIDLSCGLPPLVHSTTHSLLHYSIERADLCQCVLSEAGIVALNMLLKQSQKIDINARDKLGNTAVHYAVAQGDVRALEILLSHTPDLSIKNNEGKTAKDMLLDRQKITAPIRHISEQQLAEFRNANTSMQKLLN